jgi:chromosome segregation ATPase
MAPNMKAIDRSVHFALSTSPLIGHSRLDDVEAKLADTEKEADKARKDSKNARDQFNDVKKRRWAYCSLRWWSVADNRERCDMFNKAYGHISEHIDQVYKDLTKGKASPMGGVAYLSLEDSEACAGFNFVGLWSNLTFI